MAEEADVYVVGSGPEDNARLLDKQGPLEEAGLRRAIEVGRGGKGVIVVVPPGNGGSKGDSCAFDGMVRRHYALLCCPNSHLTRHQSTSDSML